MNVLSFKKILDGCKGRYKDLAISFGDSDGYRVLAVNVEYRIGKILDDMRSISLQLKERKQEEINRIKIGGFIEEIFGYCIVGIIAQDKGIAAFHFTEDRFLSVINYKQFVKFDLLRGSRYRWEDFDFITLLKLIEVKLFVAKNRTVSGNLYEDELVAIAEYSLIILYLLEISGNRATCFDFTKKISGCFDK